jgi:hypothetical protein
MYEKSTHRQLSLFVQRWVGRPCASESNHFCPYAYVTAYRLRRLREEYRGRVTISYKSLALEYVNRRPTPKPILDNEMPILMLEEPEIPYQPWHAPLS